MKFICCQPAIKYYTWQVEVMLDNFIENKINPEDIHIVCSYNDEIPEDWIKLNNKYSSVGFYFYKDGRSNRTYIPSIYFHLMKQHLKAHPELEKEVLFLHDCDILFTKPVDFSQMTKGNIWYLSDTVGYIGTQYVLTKGEDQYNEMCKIVGLDPLIPKLMNSNSGGAQHIVKNTTYEYWDKVEKDSVKLYTYLSSREPLWDKTKGTPIQKWTAGMWSLLWNAWLFGHETKVDKRLDFCWATCPIKRWDECAIFHNAGVTDDKNKLFFKGKYTHFLPYASVRREHYDEKRCSIKYVEQLLKTKENSCLI